MADPLTNAGAAVTVALTPPRARPDAAAVRPDAQTLDAFERSRSGQRLEVRGGFQTSGGADLKTLLSKLTAPVTLPLDGKTITLPRDARVLLQAFAPPMSSTEFKRRTGLELSAVHALLDDAVYSGVTAPINLAAKELKDALGLDRVYGFAGAGGQWSSIDGLDVRNPARPLQVTATAASTQQLAFDGDSTHTKFFGAFIERLRDGGGDVIACAMQAAAGFADTSGGRRQVSTLQVAGARNAPVAGDKHTLALVIGNGDYQQGPGRPNDLPGVAFDVKALAPALAAHAAVEVKQNLTARQMNAAARLTIDRANAGDDVVVVFSGHGITQGIVGVDAAPGSLDGVLTTAQMQSLADHARSRGINFAFVIDACHSGTIGETARLSDIAQLKVRARTQPEVLSTLTAMEKFEANKHAKLSGEVAAAAGKMWHTVQAQPAPLTPLDARRFDAALRQAATLLDKPPQSLTAEDLMVLRAVDHGFDVQLNQIRRRLP